MKELTLGRTGMKVKALGFGGIPIQRLSEEKAIEVVRRCFELGINFYDTARVYTTSEERIGKALEDIRDEVFIATKSTSRDGEGLLKDLETSLEKLRTNWIDVYQLHFVSKEHEWEKIKRPGGALEALYEAKDADKIGHLGITSHNPELLKEIVEEGIFESVMIPFNYLTPKPADGLLPLCQRLDVGTIIMKPFGGGAIRNIEAALKYVLSNESVDVVIPGMMGKAEVEENVAIALGDFTLTPVELEQIERDREELGNQFCRACDYCQPCPQGIPISFVLRAEDQFLRLTGWTPRLTRGIPEAAEKVASCVRCGECEERCPYQLPIRELLPRKIGSLLDLLAERNAQTTVS